MRSILRHPKWSLCLFCLPGLPKHIPWSWKYTASASQDGESVPWRLFSPHHRDTTAFCFHRAGEGGFDLLSFKPEKEASCAMGTVWGTIWSTETSRERRFGRCKRAVILIRQKPLGDFYTASPSSISNPNAYTRLASGTLCVLKQGAALLVYWVFVVPTDFVGTKASCW